MISVTNMPDCVLFIIFPKILESIVNQFEKFVKLGTMELNERYVIYSTYVLDEVRKHL